MKRFTAFLLVMVMLLAFVPTASAQALGLQIGNNWVINGSSCNYNGSSITIGNYNYDVDVAYGNKTCDITIKGDYRGLSAYSYDTHRWGRAIQIPYTVANADNLMVNSSYLYTPGKLVFVVDGMNDSETFMISNRNDYTHVKVTFIDTANYYYGYGYPNGNTNTVYPGYTYCTNCGSYFNNQYGYCSYCKATANYDPQNFTSKTAYLRIEGIETAGDQYSYVTVGNSYYYNSNMVLNVAAVNYYDCLGIKNGKDDYVRIRVTPVTTYGNTYPAGTIVRPAAPTSYAALEGSKKVYTNDGSYNYVLDENSSFCLNLTGIKALTASDAATYGVWSDISLFFGASSSDRYNGKIYYQKVNRATNYVNGAVVPSNVTMKVGDVMTIPYTVGNTNYANLATWKVLNTNATPVIVNSGNKVTAVKEGVAYLVATFGGNSQTIKVTVKADEDDKITVVGDDKYTVTASSLRVRKGPGTSYSTLGKVKKNTIVTGTGVVSTDGDWIQIRYNGGYGYVSANYIKAK